MLNPDYKDILSAFESEGVEYLVVGAYALAVHGLPRATGDIDLWINPTKNNVKKVWSALQAFGAPMDDLTLDDLCSKEIVYQIGVQPRRIDILTSIDGVEFDEGWRDRVEIKIEDLVIKCLGKRSLIKNKQTVGRPQDVADVENLKNM